MGKFIRIGVDLAKNYFQAHALTSEGAAVKRKLTRSKMHRFFSQNEPIFIGMEACGSAHYWGRELKAMGHDVLLMPPSYIKPYVKRGKNDAVDAEAICEAMSRPGMRFVPIKSAAQQATLMLHKTHELLVKQRTMSVLSYARQRSFRPGIAPQCSPFLARRWRLAGFWSRQQIHQSSPTAEAVGGKLAALDGH